MSTVKVAISIDPGLLVQIDQMVKEKIYPNRSKAIQSAIHEKLNRINRNRLDIPVVRLEYTLKTQFPEFLIWVKALF